MESLKRFLVDAFVGSAGSNKQQQNVFDLPHDAVDKQQSEEKAQNEAFDSQMATGQTYQADAAASSTESSAAPQGPDPSGVETREDKLQRKETTHNQAAVESSEQSLNGVVTEEEEEEETVERKVDAFVGSAGSNKQQQNLFDLLTDDIVQQFILPLVGRDHFIFIAGIDRRFRKLYSEFQEEEHRKIMNSSNPANFQNLITTKLTSTASIAESLSRAKQFFRDSSMLDDLPTACVKIKPDGTHEMNESFHPSCFLHYSVSKAALRHENADVLFFCGIGSSRSPRICRIAAQNGRLGLLKVAIANGCPPWDTETFADAANSGHLELLQWARSEGCPWNEETCSSAAYSGHLQLLQWARSEGCPWDERTCECAAFFGHFDLLQWARSEGCPWDEETCEHAALGGHLDLLQWARSEGCPWDERTCHGAAQYGHLELLRWAQSQGCPWDVDFTCDLATQGGHWELLEWARQIG